MLANITAITIEVNQTQYNNYINHLVEHGMTVPVATAAINQFLRRKLKYKILHSGIPVGPNPTLTIVFV